MKLALAVAVAVVVAAPQTHAASIHTVAVMPFRDLSGAKASIGEAIRETVTTDLKEISGMKVIERGNLDRVLAEQKLSGTSDFDTATTAKVGKLLGATMIVTGAYQKAASSVRLTARFVKVETGEIVGTAKVDGPNADFLSLQDKVTAELLKSAGIEKKTVERVARRPRPKIKSLHAVEIYGDAVSEPDDEKRLALLKAAVSEEPHFHYAVADLEALEKRLKAYDALNKVEVERATMELRKKLETEKNPQLVYSYYMQYLGRLQQEHKWRRTAAECRALMNAPLIQPFPNTPSLQEYAHNFLVTALMMLKDDDGVLREGERFLQKYPSSMSYQGIRGQVDGAIERKRERDEGLAQARQEIAALDAKDQQNPCRVGLIYNSYKQFRDAKEKFEACLQQGGSPGIGLGLVHQMLAICANETGDFKGAHAHMAEIEKADPKLYRSFKAYENVIPTAE